MYWSAPSRATANASAGRDAPTIGLLLWTKAYQVTFADVRCASAKAEQILLVGDPGQIGTVTTSNPALWQGRPAPARTRGVRPPGRRRHSAHGRQLLARVRLGPGSRRCKSSRSATALAGHHEIELLQPATGDPNNPGCSSRSPTAPTPCSAPHPDHRHRATATRASRHRCGGVAQRAGIRGARAAPRPGHRRRHRRHRRQPVGRAVHRRGGSRPADRHRRGCSPTPRRLGGFSQVP